MAGQGSKQARKLQQADKLCWTCEKKVRADRNRTLGASLTSSWSP